MKIHKDEYEYWRFRQTGGYFVLASLASKCHQIGKPCDGQLGFLFPYWIKNWYQGSFLTLINFNPYEDN